MFSFFKKKQTNKIAKLKEYIRIMKEKGYDANRIKSDLLSVGWDEAVISPELSHDKPVQKSVAWSSVTLERAKHFLRRVDKPFIVKNGVSLSSLKELCDSLQTLDDESFFHHLSDSRNDFSNWIDHVIQDRELATHIVKLNEKTQMYTVCESRLTFLNAHSR